MSITMMVILKAIKIRLARNEQLEDILNSYPKLTVEEVALLTQQLSK